MSDAKSGRFVWYDLLTNDPNAAVAFYTHVVGWSSQPFEGSDYKMFAASQGPLGGTMMMPDQAKKMGATPHWMANVQVDSVDATADKAKELGGRILMPPSDIPTVGRFAVIADPQGASIQLFKSNMVMSLHDVQKPGEVVWHELVTTDHESAYVFYSKLLGWKRIRDFDMGAMGKYVIYGQDGVELGGMFTKPKDMPMPPAWTYYIQVADLNQAIERAKSKGANLVNGPMEVPGGAHVARLIDPQGAPFALHQNK
jgi:uncharacterized protein